MDYKKLGFKCGIEIHQQLDTHKLFCECPSNIVDGKPDKTVKRYLWAAAGETGDVDIAAKHEMSKKKYFEYQYFKESSCLVELDEEPPHPINTQALKVALIVAKLLNAEIVDEIQVMRKTIVDGSNTSAFQRTALIARNGFIKTSKGKVKIDLICLEEDAAKIVKRTKKFDVYNLSRLGIPLVEIATDASIKDPEHAKEVAAKLGMILRSTKVKRGLGTIRQDVNLSIKKGARVEIKGFQDLKSMPKIIDKEIKRQQRLIKQGKKVSKDVRKAEDDLSTIFLRPIPGSARMYPETDIPPIRPDKNVEVPKLITEKIEDLKELGISKEIASTLVKEKKLKMFKEFRKFKNLDPTFIAATLINSQKDIKKRYNVEPNYGKEVLEKLFSSLDKDKIAEEAVFEILVEVSKGKKIDISKYETMSDKKLEQELKKIVESKPDLSMGALMGIAMKKFRGKAEGKKIAELIKKWKKG